MPPKVGNKSCSIGADVAVIHQWIVAFICKHFHQRFYLCGVVACCRRIAVHGQRYVGDAVYHAVTFHTCRIAIAVVQAKIYFHFDSQNLCLRAPKAVISDMTSFGSVLEDSFPGA